MGTFYQYLRAAVTGPFAARFILQPVVAALLGVKDGYRDAKTGALPYGIHLFTGKESRKQLLREGMRQIFVPLCIGIVLDIIVHFVLEYGFHPVSSILVGILLVGLPYILARGITNRIVAGHRRNQRSPKG